MCAAAPPVAMTEFISSGGEGNAQFIDHVGTEPIHSKVAQSAGVVRIVHRPHDHATAHGVDGCNEFPIDHFPVRPEITRARRPERLHPVDEVRVRQYPGRDTGEVMHLPGDPVIEAVNGCLAIGMAGETLGHERFNASSLDLDVGRHRDSCCVQHGVQRWNQFTGRTHGCCGKG